MPDLGKDFTITGIANARSVSSSVSATTIDVTKFGDTAKKFRGGLAEAKIDVECVDNPGCVAGDTVTISTGGLSGDFIVISVAVSSPVDGIVTYSVSCSRTAS
jgi:predicted secreted protein